jgi:hypothetical protein
MDDTQIETIEQVRRFLAGSGAMKMAISSKAECYEWVRATLVRFEYLTLKKTERGWLLKYLQQVSGYSRAQITRMVGQYRETGKIERRYCTANGFSRKYAAEPAFRAERRASSHSWVIQPRSRSAGSSAET